MRNSRSQQRRLATQKPQVPKNMVDFVQRAIARIGLTDDAVYEEYVRQWRAAFKDGASVPSGRSVAEALGVHQSVVSLRANSLARNGRMVRLGGYHGVYVPNTPEFVKGDDDV